MQIVNKHSPGLTFLHPALNFWRECCGLYRL